jgi:DHA2 family multidrug resistance protein
MLATGAILLATTQFLTAAGAAEFRLHRHLAGLLLSPGGLFTMLMMFVVGRIAGKDNLNISSSPARCSSRPPCTR